MLSDTRPAAGRPMDLAAVMPAGYLAMALLGAASSVYGPILPHLAAEAGRPVAGFVLLLVWHWFGFFISTAAANPLARRVGLRAGLMAGCLLIALGAAGLLGLAAPFNLGAALPIGIGAGLLEVLFNRLVEGLAGDRPAEALTRLHATWGVGAVILPLAVAGALEAGLGWRGAGALVIVIAAGVVALLARWSSVRLDLGAPAAWRGLPWRALVLPLAIVVVYVGVETAVGGWATTYFSGLGQGPVRGALATAFFFLTFTAGRLGLAAFTDRLGLARTVQLGTGLGAAALLLALTPSLAFLGFGLSGLAYSVVFPTLLAWIARRHPAIRAQTASLSIAAAGAGGVVLPYLVGLGVERWGSLALPILLIAASLTVLAASFFEPAPA